MTKEEGYEAKGLSLEDVRTEVNEGLHFMKLEIKAVVAEQGGLVAFSVFKLFGFVCLCFLLLRFPE